MKTVFQAITKKGVSRIVTDSQSVAEGLLKGRFVSSRPLAVTDDHFKAIVAAQPFYRQLEKNLRVKAAMNRRNQ